MGDLRNKLYKEIERARIKAMQDRMAARVPRPPPPRCQCGLTAHQVEKLWAHHLGREVMFYCTRCLPPDIGRQLTKPA